MAALQSASAAWFSARRTWAAVQRSNVRRIRDASAWSGLSLASLTRQRP